MDFHSFQSEAFEADDACATLVEVGQNRVRTAAADEQETWTRPKEWDYMPEAELDKQSMFGQCLCLSHRWNFGSPQTGIQLDLFKSLTWTICPVSSLTPTYPPPDLA